jgi:hypothetical protein
MVFVEKQKEKQSASRRLPQMWLHRDHALHDESRTVRLGE